MKNSDIIREVERQADFDREVQDREMPRVSRDVVTNLYTGPIVRGVPPSGRKIFDIKTRLNKIPCVLKLKSPFMVWPGDELHLSLFPAWIAATGIKGERYSRIEIIMKGKGNSQN